MSRRQKSPFKYDILDENTGFLFWQVAQVWNTAQNKMLKRRFGISQLQYVILSSTYWLNLHGKEVTHTCLANHTKVEKMTVSKNVEILEAKGYMTDDVNPLNKRSNLICVSKKGVELLSIAINYVEEFDKDFFSPLGNDVIKMNSNINKLINDHKYLFFPD
jgi:DNA-binding MarR family transcriptional regulator